MKVEVKNGKEIVIGKTIRVTDIEEEVPFFVENIKQLCFNPFESDEYKYSVLISTFLSDNDVLLSITQEQYEYLMEKF
ncbi:hypothetical protein [Lactobacillus sp.]|uniref:hypothetical protein n=1 Tax=Lactobacillus sp. TaxID=1591 RepID=UPI002582591B|nr:hypothetical protein [Lactobacillus sp.]MCO6530445.1 hypothetical protein [Lactobacillus sp.]